MVAVVKHCGRDLYAFTDDYNATMRTKMKILRDLEKKIQKVMMTMQVGHVGDDGNDLDGNQFDADWHRETERGTSSTVSSACMTVLNFLNFRGSLFHGELTLKTIFPFLVKLRHD
jgi:hypothetical protein